METEYIAGIPVDCLTYQTLENDLPRFFSQGKKMFVTSINPQIVLQVRENKEIYDYIKKATHRIPDGVGIVLMSKLLGGKIKARVTGFDSMLLFLDYANRQGHSIFLYGAQPLVVEQTVQNIAKDYPAIKIVGYENGFTQKTEQQVVETINQVKPDFLFVALGAPKQEIFLNRQAKNIDTTVFLDVGGSFDVLSNTVNRAPDWTIRLHIEWLYRSLTMKRYDRLRQLPHFMWLAVKDRQKKTPTFKTGKNKEKEQ